MKKRIDRQSSPLISVEHKGLDNDTGVAAPTSVDGKQSTSANDGSNQISGANDDLHFSTKPLVQDVSPRESMRVLPAWMQPFLTELTGMPLEGEKLILRWTWQMRLLLAWFVLAASLATSNALVNAGTTYWFLLPFSWIFTVSALRAFQTTFVHHASHGNLSGKLWLDNILGELMSIVAWIMPLSAYAEGHIKGHHPRTGLLDGNGADDPDLRFIVNYMGFKPGKSRREYWFHLMCLIVSPAFHVRFFMARSLANLVTATPKRRFAALVYALSIAGLTALFGDWILLTLAVLIPGIWLYQVSGVLQVLTEHAWVRDTSGQLSKREILVRLTFGRFLGCRVPDTKLPTSLRVLAWIVWFAKMVGVYFPARIFFLMGDLPQHDLHHYSTFSDWKNPAYARRDAVMKTREANSNTYAYIGVWGLRAMFNRTFDHLASITEDSELGKPLTYRQRDDLLLQM